MTKPAPITRNQLAEFLPNQRAIKAFEQLLRIVGEDTPSDIDAVSLDASLGLSGAAEIAQLAYALGRYVELTKQSDTNADNSIVTDYVDMRTTAPVANKVGRIWWGSTGTMNVGMGGGAITQQVGEEIFTYGKADSIINDVNVQLVYKTGTVGASGALRFAPAVAGITDSDLFIGVATEPVSANAFCRVTSFGNVNNVNTSGSVYGETWADNDDIWYNPVTGGLTKTRPTAPGLKCKIGTVLRAGSGSSGAFRVNIQESRKLGDLSDVTVNSPRDLDLIQYNTANARWESGQTPWVDIDFPILIRTTGANIPALTTINGNLTMPQWAVNDFNVCESQEFIHGWKEGSTVYWHLHMTTNGLEAVNKYVRFELEYGYVTPDGVWQFPAVYTSPDILIPANTPDKTMMIVSLASFTPTGVKIGGHVVARLKRVASVGAAPAANPWIPMLQMHVQLDTIGSRNIGTK